jgi:hypothetical protein
LRSDLSPRLLALPADIRATLAGVEGPGWVVYHDRHKPFPCATVGGKMCIDEGSAWFPANPAAAVAAVLGYDLRRSHERLADWLDAHGGDDHVAALSIIEAAVEAAVAARGPHV